MIPTPRLGALRWLPAVLACMLLGAGAAWALEPNEYRQLLGLDSRRLIWFLAQVKLFFAAFVLGVPLFAVTIEYIGWRTNDAKYDKLAYEFTSLLSVAYATTAALGGLFAFALYGLYPTFMGYMTGIFRDVMFLYALLFFAETFTLYLYYYGWNWLGGRTPFSLAVQRLFKGLGIAVLALTVLFLAGGFGPPMRGDTRWFMALLYLLPVAAGLFIIRDAKGVHIFIGILLNVAGTAIMQVANSWAGFMMSPQGVDKEGVLTGTVWQAFENVLATPIAVHRMLGNMAFGGLIAGAYAAVKFIGAKTEDEKAHYDWMGYVANFIAISALIPLPFAGYYLGREVYSFSAVMGNNMMGGDFSWTFIIQAVLVGSLFILSNYYLWTGMTRIPGAERYYGYIKYILGALVVSFAIWLTPHNLPLTGTEVGQMGGSQYHPTLKFMGLMPAKNAVINLIILSTFFSFLLYRRGNKLDAVAISAQGWLARGVILAAAAVSLYIVGQYALSLFLLEPKALDLPADRAGYFRVLAWLLVAHCAAAVAAAALALADRGKLAQNLFMAVTAFNVTLFLGVYGFVVMEKASPFLRNIAVAQFLMIIACLVLVTAIDVFLFRGAREVGRLQWGRIPVRSQYALLALSFVITMNMGLMGFIRSGLRGDWHIVGVMRDTSPWSFTPSNFTMTQMVSLSVLVFMVSIAFMFWLGGIMAKHKSPPAEAPAPREEPTRA
ncbi:MAG: cytochrome ubiquinol oxidase subunit I [Burkholderiales bacterium]|nr:cytochrome ubiquinol oxidase subunit I [Burkholderiales bacterium]